MSNPPFPTAQFVTVPGVDTPRPDDRPIEAAPAVRRAPYTYLDTLEAHITDHGRAHRLWVASTVAPELGTAALWATVGEYLDNLDGAVTVGVDSVPTYPGAGGVAMVLYIEGDAAAVIWTESRAAYLDATIEIPPRVKRATVRNTAG